MSKALKVTFLIHAIVALGFGVPLLLAPGRFLMLFGWDTDRSFIEPRAGSSATGTGLGFLAWLASYRESAGQHAARDGSDLHGTRQWSGLLRDLLIYRVSLVRLADIRHPGRLCGCLGHFPVQEVMPTGSRAD